MLLIPCLYCGPRDETEFHYGGQAHVPYPEHPDELSDAEWAEFLFYRSNTKGIFAERWLHRTGCRQWFNVLRDTVTYDIQAVYGIGEDPPSLSLSPTAEQGTASTGPDSTTLGSAAPDVSGTTNAVESTTPKEAHR